MSTIELSNKRTRRKKEQTNRRELVLIFPQVFFPRSQLCGLFLSLYCVYIFCHLMIINQMVVSLNLLSSIFSFG